MFNLDHLIQERGRKAILAQGILDKAEKAEAGPRPLDEEECKLFDKLHEEIKALDVQIKAVQEHNKRREVSAARIEELERPIGQTARPQEPQNRPDPNAGALSTFRVPASARRTGVLKAFTPRQGETAAECDVRAYRAGMWLRMACFNDQRAGQWCLNNGLGLDIRGAMGGSSNPDGGFLVPEEFSRAVIDLREQYGIFRQQVRVWPMGSDTLDIPRRSGGVTIGPVGENPASAISQSNPTFNMVKLVAKKAGGLCLLSSEIAEDAVIDLADWVAQEFAYGFSLFEDQCAYLGDGTLTYLGITGLKSLFSTNGAPGGGTLKGAVSAASGHDTMAEIDQTDIASCMAALPQYAKMNAKFYCSSVFDEMVFGRLLAVAGGNTVQTLQGLRGRSYMGYPIVISQVMETSLSTINGTPYLFFGDLSKSSALGDRRQVRVFPSEHRYMDTDQIGIRGTERFDLVHNDVGDTSTAGPVVALLGKT